MKHKQAETILLNAERIAVVRTDRLGDMVLTLPLARALKERFPKASIEMIARSYTMPLLYQSPVLDAVHCLDEKSIREIFQSQKYDAVFFPRPVFDEALVAFTTRVPLRIGSAYRWYSPLFNYRIPDHRKVAEYHEAQYNTRMLGHILHKEVPTGLVIPVVKQDAVSRINDLFHEHIITEPFIVLHPASRGSAYEWSAENFAMLTQSIHQKTEVKIVITGTQSESEKCSVVKERCESAINLCAKLNLDEMIALLARTSLLVANSTGVLHIAAALGKPVLGLYPNTPHISAKRWGPYSPSARIISPPSKDNISYNDAMEEISVDTVVKEVIGLL